MSYVYTILATAAATLILDRLFGNSVLKKIEDGLKPLVVEMKAIRAQLDFLKKS